MSVQDLTIGIHSFFFFLCLQPSCICAVLAHDLNPNRCPCCSCLRLLPNTDIVPTTRHIRSIWTVIPRINANDAGVTLCPFKVVMGYLRTPRIPPLLSMVRLTWFAFAHTHIILLQKGITESGRSCSSDRVPSSRRPQAPVMPSDVVAFSCRLLCDRPALVSATHLELCGNSRG